VGDLEDKVELLRGVLASPVGEDDLLEKDRRVELRRFVFIQMHVNLLIPFSGGSMESSQSLNRSLGNMHFSNSYGMLIMPKPWMDLLKSWMTLSNLTRYELPAPL